MPEQRRLRWDLFALALLAFSAFLGMSLLTYNSADTPSTLVYPPGGKVANACGRGGAFVAEMLLRGLGAGGYFVWVSLVVLDVFLLARREVTEPVLRTIGWVMALVGICTFASLAFPSWTGPAIGPGGYVGASGRTLLELNFAAAGSFVLTISVILAGLLLCTDYVLFRLGALIVGKPTIAAARLSQKALVRRGSAVDGNEEGPRVKLRGRRSDVEEPVKEAGDEELEDKNEPAVKVRGKRVEEETDDEDIAEDEKSVDGESEDDGDLNEDATPAKTSKPSIGERLASALRIKNLSKNAERERVIEELEAAAAREDATANYEMPSIELLLANEAVFQEEHEKEVREKAKKLEQTFASFGFKVKVVEIETGPVIAQYEVELEAGLRLSKITSLADDLAIALRVPSVRIVAPIPGKNTVGIEVPNASRQLVRLREVIEETNGKAKKMRIPVYLGKDVAGNPMVFDLTTLPHLLIAGRTGTGKSVCLNSIIVSMLMTRRPDEVKMLLIDPKMVELSPYKRLPHLMHPVVTDMRKAEAILAWAVEKMEERYALLARAGVRHVSVYNQLGEEELMDRLQPETDDERKSIPLNLPYIVIVADEMADLMMTSGKEVEQHIIRLAQKSRAVGIHLILATQKPTVDVITGLIKSNLPARIAFQVASRVDSRVVLDEMGAERLLGNGDLLFLWPGTSTLLRGQGTYLSDDEINRVVDFVGTTEPQFAKELVALKPKSNDDGKNGPSLKNRDELYESAVDVVIREGRGSVSLLQRALGIGYGRAARLIDYMAEDGIVGEYNGSQARDVLITLEQWADMQGEKPEPEPPQPPKPKRNRILPDPDDELADAEGERDDELDEEDEEEEEYTSPPIRGPHHKPAGSPSSTASARLSVTVDDDIDEDCDDVEDAGDEDEEPDDAYEDDEYDADESDGEGYEDGDEEDGTEEDGEYLDDESEDDHDTDDASSDTDEDAGDDDDREDDDDEPPFDASAGKYAHINPALLARLREKQRCDREPPLRRSA